MKKGDRIKIKCPNCKSENEIKIEKIKCSTCEKEIDIEEELKKRIRKSYYAGRY